MEGKSAPEVRPHVAFYLPSLEAGGAERVVLQLARGLAERGLKVDLVLTRAQGEYLSQVPTKVNLINLRARNTYTSLWGLSSYLRREKPQALLTTLPLSDLIALLARQISGVSMRVIVRLSTALSVYPRTGIKKWLEYFLLSHFYSRADGIIAVSRGVAKDVADYLNLPMERIRVIYNPVITSQMLIAAKEAVAHSWFQGTVDAGEASPVILGVGRLTPEKDFPTLLRAFALVRKTRSARLIILGEGKQRRELERLIADLDREESHFAEAVSMPGYTDNPFAYMSRAAVFVLSSIFEGLPGVLIQAMACGCPVVSTDCPHGPAEILDGGRYGYLTPVGDHRLMAEKILAVLDGKVLRPPAEWLKQFEIEPALRQYLDVMLG